MLPLALRVLGTHAFLGTMVILAVGLVVIAVALLTHRPRLLRGTTIALGGWLAAYGVALVAGPLLTAHRRLAAGEELAFCGFDCHLHVSLARVEADGATWVTLRLRSDAKAAPEYPSHLRVRAVDADGHQYQPTAGALAAMLPAGATMDSRLRFDLPAAARDPRLIVTWGDWEDYVVPGPENALVQRKRSIPLQPVPAS